MIRRPAGPDAFHLITQHDHALLAGELARRFGATGFAPPLPLAETVTGVSLHDAGWRLHDDDPTLNPAGLPLHVFEVPVPIAVRVWSASVDQAIAAGDYPGLLVSLHVLNLSALLMSHAFVFKPGDRAQSPALSRPDQFEMNKFQHRQVEIQEALRDRLGFANDAPRQLGLAPAGTSPLDDQLRSNFRILTLMDRLSLSLCCGKNLFPTIDDVPPAPGQPPRPLTLSMPDDRTLTIAPWPFADPEIRLPIRAKRLPATPYADVDQLRAAYRAAPEETIELVTRAE
ncbi:MAG: DUF3891 family protein [Phycisphaerae bacterium]|nr:DUF3891 family protein [Tepidisphaeraceae bacterium]